MWELLEILLELDQKNDGRKVMWRAPELVRGGTSMNKGPLGCPLGRTMKLEVCLVWKVLRIIRPNYR